MTLTPGGNHLMFQKPTAPLKVGDKVVGSMTFEKAGTIPVTFPVAGMAGQGRARRDGEGHAGDGYEEHGYGSHGHEGDALNAFV